MADRLDDAILNPFVRPSRQPRWRWPGGQVEPPSLAMMTRTLSMILRPEGGALVFRQMSV